MSPIHTRERGNVFSEEGKEKSALRSRDTRWRNFWKREARNPRHRAPTPGCGNWSGREAEKGRERVGNTAAFPLRCNSGSLNLAGCPSSPHYPPPSCATVRLLFPPHPRRAQARQNRAPLSSKDPPQPTPGAFGCPTFSPSPAVPSHKQAGRGSASCSRARRPSSPAQRQPSRRACPLFPLRRRATLTNAGRHIDEVEERGGEREKEESGQQRAPGKPPGAPLPPHGPPPPRLASRPAD